MIRRALRHRVGVALAALALAGVFALAVIPTRALLDQRRQRDGLATQLAGLRAANQALAQQAAELDTPDEIERLARLHYQMVKPGEEAYVILPDERPPPTTPAPAVPAPSPSPSERGWLGRVWDRITSVF